MQIINSDKAPAAIGAYSQAIRSGDMVFLSGQIAIDCITMQLSSDNIEDQINKVIDNLQEVCFAAGGSLANIVKLNVFLVDISNFSLVNNIMEKRFTKPYPARALIEVSALPKNAKVEMDAIMMLPSKQA